jgi:hypothetical protein
MHTKVMRSASSEDIRSEARRAIRTREGKGRHVSGIRPLYFGAVISGPRESGAGGFAPSGGDLGGQTTETLYCRDVHNVER